MAYKGAGVELRMPSAAAVRRFASKLADETKRETVSFDVPVSVVYPAGFSPDIPDDGKGGEASGWVRVTHGADGSWGARALGPDTRAGQYMAESVQCVLEARRPSHAIKDAGNLLDRRKRRQASIGATLGTGHSDWVRAGYDRDTKTLILETANGAAGYVMSEKAYQAMYNVCTPEKVYQAIYNGCTAARAYQMVRQGKLQRVEVRGCKKCDRYFARLNGASRHTCPPKEASREDMAAGAAEAAGSTIHAAVAWLKALLDRK
jgi:hypothetical protein